MSDALNGREAAILHGLLATYFATSAPVGSRRLAESQADSPSPATIRHVMADLETRGFLTHPHTSAGRVPTTLAIRWWLQQMDAPSPLAGEGVPEFERALREASDDATLWRLASEFLSDASHQVGVVAVRAWQHAGLRHLRLFRLTEHRVLAILEATDGQVRERVSRIPEAYSQSELDAAARYFNKNFAGLTLARIEREMVKRVEAEREAYHALVKRVLVLTHSGVLPLQGEGEVYMQGTGNLAAACSSENLAAMLARLGQKERWLQLLTEFSGDATTVVWTDAFDPGLKVRPSVQVRVGLDDEAMPEFSLISAHYRQGAIGILGKTCMEFPRALGAVALVQDLFERVLGNDHA